MQMINRSIINEAYLKTIISDWYSFDSAIAINFWRSGIAGNDVYVINDRKRKYILKIYNNNIVRDQIEGSIEVMRYLHEKKINVPELYANKNGKHHIKINYPEGNRIAVLTEFINGKEPSIFDENDAMKIGNMIGKMYKCLDSFEPMHEIRRINQQYLVQRAIDGIEKYKGGRNGIITCLSNSGNELWQKLEKLVIKAKPEYGICHGDLHTGNMIKADNGDIYLFDFDSCGYGYRIYDLGIYANDDWEAKTIIELKKDIEALELLQIGLMSSRTLSTEEKKAFPYMLGLRHLELFGIVLNTCVVNEGIHWIENSLKFHFEWFAEWNMYVQLEAFRMA